MLAELIAVHAIESYVLRWVLFPANGRVGYGARFGVVGWFVSGVGGC